MSGSPGDHGISKEQCPHTQLVDSGGHYPTLETLCEESCGHLGEEENSCSPVQLSRPNSRIASRPSSRVDSKERQRPGTVGGTSLRRNLYKFVSDDEHRRRQETAALTLQGAHRCHVARQEAAKRRQETTRDTAAACRVRAASRCTSAVIKIQSAMRRRAARAEATRRRAVIAEGRPSSLEQYVRRSSVGDV